MTKRVGPYLTGEELREWIDLDPATGLAEWKYIRSSHWWFWTAKPEANRLGWNTRKSGKPALVDSSGNGYTYGQILGRRYYAHRAAWAIYYGAHPAGIIDHANGDRSDNRIENLRLASAAENVWNSKVHATNTSGFRGVSICSTTKRWLATARNGLGQKVTIGRFDTPEDAARAYDQFIAARRNPAFVRLNFPAGTAA
jgi:hypothetical protein